jgi:hypothetical protein
VQQVRTGDRVPVRSAGRRFSGSSVLRPYGILVRQDASEWDPSRKSKEPAGRRRYEKRVAALGGSVLRQYARTAASGIFCARVQSGTARDGGQAAIGRLAVPGER